MKKQTLLLLFLLNMIITIVLLSDFSKTNSEYSTIETLCDADAYVSNFLPDTNRGDSQCWYAGNDTSEVYFIYFLHFNFSDKPKSY